jgi:hypothetical protein
MQNDWENLYILKKYNRLRMKIKGIVLTAVLFTLLLAGAAALPNLKVNWVEYVPASERIVAEVYNNSGEDVESFQVAFFVDGKEHDVPSSETGFELGSRSITRVYSNFPNDGNIHHFYVVVDPGNEVEESNEEDNTGSKRIDDWAEPLEILRPPSRDNEREYLSFMLMWGGVALVVIVIMYFTIRRMVKKRHE